MSDTTPPEEPDEVEALTGHDEVDEAASPDDDRPASPPTVDGGIDAEREVDLGSGEPEPTDDGADDGTDASVPDTDATGQDVEDAGTGTADTSDDPKLDSPD